MNSQEQFYKFKIGAFNCVSFFDNNKEIKLSKLFPTLSSKSKFYSENYLMGFNLLYLEIDETKILVDTGLRDGNLIESMQKAGISPIEIDMIFLTHGDGDHIGGLSKFGNAKIYMVKELYDKWTSQSGLSMLINEFEFAMKQVVPQDILAKKINGRRMVGESVLPSLKSKIELVNVEEEFFSGIKFIEAYGHRSDHYAIEFTSGEDSLIHIADAMRHRIQISDHSLFSVFDSYPEMTLDTIRKLCNRAKLNKSKIFGAHLGFPGLVELNIC